MRLSCLSLRQRSLYTQLWYSDNLGRRHGGLAHKLASVYFVARARAISMYVSFHSLSGFKLNICSLHTELWDFSVFGAKTGTQLHTYSRVRPKAQGPISTKVCVHHCSARGHRASGSPHNLRFY